MVDGSRASTTTSSTASSSSNDVNVNASFRNKANFMKGWKPSSTPSNRDRLELYALHKQAVSGDAPHSLSTSNAADRAKYSAWRAKSGMHADEAMRQYVVESDRQIRVYGVTAALENPNDNNPTQTQGNHNPRLEGGTNANNSMSSSSSTNQRSRQSSPPSSSSYAQQPRGLAAIPLLCAAASESRQAYLRRLAQTRPEQAWWNRQEPLCASPNSILSLPEWLVIKCAAVLEWISLVVAPLSFVPVPAAVVQSFLWPFHNVLLGLWMGTILAYTALISAWDLLQTLLWGSRRTSQSLQQLWKDQVAHTSTSIQSLNEKHQPLTARLVGLPLLPYTWLTGVLASLCSTPWASALYISVMAVTWWYWTTVLPFLGSALLLVSLLAGSCFAVIELASV